jgi:hypothetical protein
MRYQIQNTISFVVMIAVNSLANILPINGKSTGELSDQYPNLFVPAGITFSIWGVIYLLLLSVMVVQFFLRYRETIQAQGWNITLNFCLNALWIIAWHYEQVALSLVIMLALLGTLVRINSKLSRVAGWFMPLAFGVYLGWICLATIANVTALLVSLSWDGFGINESAWAISIIGVGAAIASLVIYKLANPFLALALVWGFYGIVLKRQVDYPGIAAASYIGMVVVGAMSAFVLFTNYMRRSA